MTDAATIRTAFERNQKALELRPSMSRKTVSTTARVRHGLHCEIEAGPWTLTVAAGKEWGGSGDAPSAGVFGRAALGSCLALGYAIWAAQLGVPFDGIQVDIQAELDGRGSLGLDDVPAGYTEMTYIVTIDSPASEADVLRVLDTADAHSPWLNNLRRPMALHRELRLKTPRA